MATRDRLADYVSNGFRTRVEYYVNFVLDSNCAVPSVYNNISEDSMAYIG